MASEKIASLRVERRALADMRPHPRNPRSHPARGSKEWIILGRSLERDYFDPLVLNDCNGMLVSGHLRLKVLLERGFTHADVSVVEYDEQTHCARLIAANNLLGEWEEEVLSALAGDLDQAGIDAALAGWDGKQLVSRLDGPQVTDDSETALVLVSKAEELQEKWNVQPGDLYSAAEHRLFCGDCTAPENWRAMLGTELADLVWTDPPYNVNYDSIQRRRIELKAADGQHVHAKPEAIMNDCLSDAAYSTLLHTCFSTAFFFTKPGGAIYIAHADSYGLLTRQAAAAAGFHVAQCLIWVKNAFTLGRQDHQWQHEPILYGWKPGAAHYWQGGFSQASVIDDEEKNLSKLAKEDLIGIINRLRNARETTVIREARNTGNALHPTVKPLALVARQIWNSSRHHETVLELFGGSGTTILAAEQTGRRCVATELDPKFCAVILERLTLSGLSVEKISGP